MLPAVTPLQPHAVTVTNNAKVVELPYLGPRAEDKARQLYGIETVTSFDDFIDDCDALSSFIRKVDRLADMLDCTPLEAERMLLKHL